MKRVLITGMSGTGKSTVVQELTVRGYRAIDLDTPEWSEWVDIDPSDTLAPRQGKDWKWRENRVGALLSERGDRTLFISGCADNMGRFLPRLDSVILLSAPLATIMQRLSTRPVGSYGHLASERQKVVDLISTVEPLLRKSANYEIDTRLPIPAVVDEVLRLS
jgi:shikimate kinase